jgi:hypothetical protein
MAGFVDAEARSRLNSREETNFVKGGTDGFTLRGKASAVYGAIRRQDGLAMDNCFCQGPAISIYVVAVQRKPSMRL